jgi:lauroyl/myristoyl acyltransferase
MAGANRAIRPRDIIPAALAVSGVLRGPALLGIRPALARLLHAVPALRRTVRRRMAALLGADAVPADAVRRYFEHVADLAVFSLLTMRHGFAGAGLAAQFELEESTERLRRPWAEGRGALMVAPHLVCHELASARGNMLVPTTALIRHSSDPQHEARKVRWYQATGMEIVYRPNGAGSELREVVAAVAALRAKKLLGITPDLLQDPGKGVEVAFFGRKAWLPPGPAYLASRTGACLVPSFFWHDGARYRLTCEAPIEVPASGDREAVTRDMMQEWCRLFEQFLRRHPDMWLFWLDKRWGQWIESTS